MGNYLLSKMRIVAGEDVLNRQLVPKLLCTFVVQEGCDINNHPFVGGGRLHLTCKDGDLYLPDAQ
jgi:hypothetical protein